MMMSRTTTIRTIRWLQQQVNNGSSIRGIQHSSSSCVNRKLYVLASSSSSSSVCSSSSLLEKTTNKKIHHNHCGVIIVPPRPGSCFNINNNTSSSSSAIQSFSVSTKPTNNEEGLPDSIKRVGTPMAFPNEYPGQNYAFNWCLNKVGVTPLKKSSFRITKPLDLKIAGLQQPKTNPLKVKPAPDSSMPEAGTDALSFEQFDEVSQRTRDLLSLSDHLYCPEGHVPGTRRTVRIITNSPTLAPDVLAYLERAPKTDPPERLSINVYVLEGTEESFSGFCIEEIDEPIDIPKPVDEERALWMSKQEHLNYKPIPVEPRSIGSVIVVGQKPRLDVVVAGILACEKPITTDEIERQQEKMKRSESE